jgi:AcrR family transcriptional regulator
MSAKQDHNNLPSDSAQSEEWLQQLMLLNDQDEKMTDKQIRIIQSAVDIFSAKGYAATSTSEIAQKAGVAEGTIFRHYKTKKELLLSIIGPIMTKMVAPLLMRDFTKVLETPYDKLEHFLRAVMTNRLEFARTHMPLLKIMIHEIPFHPELKDQFIEGVAHQVIERFEKITRHFQQQGQIIETPPLRAIRFMFTSIAGYILIRLLFATKMEWNDEEEIEATIRFIMHGLSTENIVLSPNSTM